MTRIEKQFNYIKIKLASPVRILEWSLRRLPNGEFVGEVQNSQTINYRSFKPETDGLFCERIFGPVISCECACGKYKRMRYSDLICESCGVELTESYVRRHRMGHINLIYPVTHVWYINSRPNYMALLLEVEQCEKRIDTGIDSIDCFLNYDQVSPPSDNMTPQEWQENYREYNEEFSKNVINLYVIIKRNNRFSSVLIWDKIKLALLNLKKKLQIKSEVVNLKDNRIKRIKLASLVYFLAEDEISFYGLHWDLQRYRRSRELGYSGYPIKQGPKPKISRFRRNIPKYLLRVTPSYLIGSALIKKELEALNLNRELIKTRKFVNICTKVLRKEEPFYKFSKWQKKWEYKRIYKLRSQAIKRIRILENLIATNSNPAWMVLTILPVIPAALRPMIQLEGGRFATSDLNELYRRIINRNDRLLRLLEVYAPQVVIRNEKRLLQEAVDNLIDNGKRGKIASGTNNRPLKSLSDIIKGKQGRFRLNLLGKRVDYSGRSVIVVGPNLKLNQCGLPYEMAIELFQSFIIRELINRNLANTIRMAKKLIQQNESGIEAILEEIVSNHPIFLNRAPTLHRLGVQAFQPVLIQGRAIQLHPLVCSAFNADFDGDQMAVHVPLSLESQAECYMLMLAPYNFLLPANAEPVIIPSQDMVLGCYYLTVNNIKNLLGSNHYFADFEDVLTAYQQEQLELHTAIWVRYNNHIPEPSSLIRKIKLKDESYIEYYENLQIRKDKMGRQIVQYIYTTTGRIIFNYTIQKTLKLFK